MPKEIDKKVMVEKAVKTTMAGDLIFDVAIPEGIYGILKSYMDVANSWHSIWVEILEDYRIQLQFTFGEIISGIADIKKDTGKTTVKETKDKLVNLPLGDFLFEIAIPEDKYNIYRAYKKHGAWTMARIELLEDSKLHIALVFGSIKARRVIVPKGVDFWASDLTVEED